MKNVVAYAVYSIASILTFYCFIFDIKHMFDIAYGNSDFEMIALVRLVNEVSVFFLLVLFKERFAKKSAGG